MKGMNFMKQAKEMMDRLQTMKAEMQTRTQEVSVGGGMVTVVVRGDNRLVSIKIDPEVVDPDDITMLQDLIVSAVNEALRKIQDSIATEMNSLTGGLNIPGFMG